MKAHRSLRAMALLLSFVSPLTTFAGGLTYKDAAEDLTRPEAVAVAPSDKYVYSVSPHDSSVSVWTRDTGTGLLTLKENWQQGELIAPEPVPPATPVPSPSPVPLNGLDDVNEVAVAAANPDGAHVYVAARRSIGGGVTAFKSRESDGQLTLIHTYRPNDMVCLGGPNQGVPCTIDSECPSGACNFEIPVQGASAIALNPDTPAGQHLYVAARGADSIAVFSRNDTTGALTLTSAAVDGQGTPPVSLMQAPRNLAFSPDGLNLYVSAQKTQSGNKDGTIVVFDRNTTTGELTFKQALKYNDPLVTVPVVQRMPNAEDLVVSPDGNFLYVSGGSGDAIVIFTRAGDGTLTYLGYQSAGELKNARGITISPELAGKYVFATGTDDNAVNVYTRDATTGQLLLLDSRRDADAPTCVGGGNDGAVCKKPDECPGGVCDPRPELFNAQGVALSMDKKQLYVTSSFRGSITIFENDICGNGKVGSDEECDTGTDCTVDCKLDVCAPAPIPCKTPTVVQQSSLTIKNNALKSDTKDTLQWKWKKGAATTDVDYGDPTSLTGATYVLCVYDNTGLRMSRAAPRAGTCDKAKPCWKTTISGGALKKYTYQDKLLTPVGLSDVQLTVGIAGKAQISVKGKGAFLQPPALPLTLPVTVQLMNTQTAACWGATFTTTTSDPMDATKLTAKGQ